MGMSRNRKPPRTATSAGARPFWSAPAERSGDGALAPPTAQAGPGHPSRLPPGFPLSAQGCRVGEATLGAQGQRGGPNPVRVASSIPPPSRPGFCNPFRVGGVVAGFPRVAAQPWAEGWNPFGIQLARTFPPPEGRHSCRPSPACGDKNVAAPRAGFSSRGRSPHRLETQFKDHAAMIMAGYPSFSDLTD